MFISKYVLYIPEVSGESKKKSIIVANAMMIELLNYGILVDSEIISRISRLKPKKAKKFAYAVLKSFTIGDVNPPLFNGWEDRAYFSFGELIVQVVVYMFQVSGNDLENPRYLEELKDRIDFKKTKALKLADRPDAESHFESLINTGQSREQQRTIKDFAKEFSVDGYIKSDESRIAVLLSSGLENIKALKCKPADVLRFFAARHEFEQVNLPHGVIYDKMKWQERKKSYEFLSTFDEEYIMESMGNNRAAWYRFFSHTHLFQQKELMLKYNLFSACAWVSIGSKIEATPAPLIIDVESLIKRRLVEMTHEGALVYRTFASRVQSAIDSKNYAEIESLMKARPGYLMRNIATVSNAVKKKHETKFLLLCREAIKKSGIEVLFSILQIDVRAKYRIIDVKGDTLVNEADYSPYLMAIQKDIENELASRYGREGKIKVADSLKNNIVPFLARNQELFRGTKIPFGDESYLHFFMHWIQANYRTDLDHSHIIFHADGRTETIAFYNQANAYISQSGDITNAPAPSGATEYSIYRLDMVPPSVEYIVPVINVYTGENFKQQEEAYAGFMFNDSKEFNINRKHVRYALSQPAKMNIPFVLDMVNREIIVVDYNARSNYQGTRTAVEFKETIVKVISVSQSMNKMTIERFAKILSGEGKTELTIKTSPKGENEISPTELSKLVA